MISINGLEKWTVLKALHQAASPHGNGGIADIMAMVANARGTRSDDSYKEAVSGSTSFDYFDGVPLKVNLSGDEFDPRLFDRDAGPGAAKKAIDELRAK